jgi:Rrf2 family protein
MPSRANSGPAGAELSFLQLKPAARYALRGAAAVAAVWGTADRYMLVSEAARREELPANFLAKIFQRLARRGLLESRRGPGGGYALTRSPSLIALADVLRAAQEESPAEKQCLLRGGRCRERGACLLHLEGREADTRFRRLLETTTLAQMIKSGGA